LPRTVNGKLDKAALPQIVSEAAPTYVAPQSATEQQLAQIWQEILGQERVSVTRSFFELGGHSLLATRMVNAVQRRLAIELPIRTIFEKPDIRTIAAVIDEQGIRQGNLRMADTRQAQVEVEW
jgi:acyl carrier protein